MLVNASTAAVPLQVELQLVNSLRNKTPEGEAKVAALQIIAVQSVLVNIQSIFLHGVWVQAHKIFHLKQWLPADRTARYRHKAQQLQALQG